jgi:fermentation-respiration switch protein FrsA (DUF1100 family)
MKSPLDQLRGLVTMFLRFWLVFATPISAFQRSLIYYPNRTGSLPANESGLSQPVADLIVTSHDRVKLHGWILFQHSSKERTKDDPAQLRTSDLPVVLFFSGNAGDRSMRTVPLQTLRSMNAHVVIVDYRGYAENKGHPSESAIARDARAIWNHLTRELQIPEQRIVIYGESLGGGVGCRLASELCREGIEPGGLILQSTFSSLVDAAQFHFPVLPVSLLLVDRYPSVSRVSSVTCPILQIHGALDTIVPLNLGQKLFDAVQEKSSQGVPKRQVVLPNCDHNDVYSELDSHELLNALRDFLITVTEESKKPKPVRAVELSPRIVDDEPGNSSTVFLMIGFAAIIIATFALIWWRSRAAA